MVVELLLLVPASLDLLFVLSFLPMVAVVVVTLLPSLPIVSLDFLMVVVAG